MKAAALAAAALAMAGCGTNIAETATVPPRHHAASPSAELIGVAPSESVPRLKRR